MNIFTNGLETTDSVGKAEVVVVRDALTYCWFWTFNGI